MLTVSSALVRSFSIAEAVTTFKLYPVESKPFGHTYGEWSSKFWQWYMNISTVPGPHPSDDPTGSACNKSQAGPVWFLAGSSGSKQDRTCVIPYGKAIIINPISGECSVAENPTLKSEAELRSCAKVDQDKVNAIRLIVDGVSLTNISKYRIASPLFNFTLPENNNLGLDAQSTQAVSDGYWVILEPLPKGIHTIRSTGSLLEPTTTGVNNFVSDVAWQIVIK